MTPSHESRLMFWLVTYHIINLSFYRAFGRQKESSSIEVEKSYPISLSVISNFGAEDTGATRVETALSLLAVLIDYFRKKS